MGLIAGSGNLWSGGIVPFSIDIDVDAAHTATILAGIANFAGTGVQLVPHNAESSYIHFAVYPDPTGSGSECSPGRQGGAQVIWVGSPPTPPRNITHEICH